MKSAFAAALEYGSRVDKESCLMSFFSNEKFMGSSGDVDGASEDVAFNARLTRNDAEGSVL